MQEFSQLMQYLLGANSIDVKAGDFNYDRVTVTEKKTYIFTNHFNIVNKPTHMSGLLLDQVYIKKTLIEEFSTNVHVENIYFSDHDAARILVDENTVYFYTIL